LSVSRVWRLGRYGECVQSVYRELAVRRELTAWGELAAYPAQRRDSTGQLLAAKWEWGDRSRSLEVKVPSGFRDAAGCSTVWIVEMLLFHPSRKCCTDARFLLRTFGARIGKGVLIRRSVSVTYPWKLTIGDWCWVGDQATLYTLGEITIAENTVISQHAYLCASSHDYTRLHSINSRSQFALSQKHG